MRGTITVVNKYHFRARADDVVVYIGRGSPLGNPWPIKAGTSETREVVIQRYKDNLPGRLSNEGTMQALSFIEQRVRDGCNVKLVCFCKPQACHGDWIKQLVEKNL